jgi:hypothetical protein
MTAGSPGPCALVDGDERGQQSNARGRKGVPQKKPRRAGGAEWATQRHIMIAEVCGFRSKPIRGAGIGSTKTSPAGRRG